MIISLRRTVILVLLALTLLLSLVGWSMKIGTSPTLPHHSSMQGGNERELREKELWNSHFRLLFQSMSRRGCFIGVFVRLP